MKRWKRLLCPETRTGCKLSEGVEKDVCAAWQVVNLEHLDSKGELEPEALQYVIQQSANTDNKVLGSFALGAHGRALLAMVAKKIAETKDACALLCYG